MQLIEGVEQTVGLIQTTAQGRRLKRQATLKLQGSRIFFVKSPFELKDEIKAMQGSKWHGFEDPPIKQWSIANSDRNRFQLSLMSGENPYARFDKPLVEHTFTRPLMEHQKLMVNTALTYHVQIWAAEMGTGKSLAAIEVIERVPGPWLWIGPKKTLKAMEIEFRQWGADPSRVTFLTYDGLTKWQREFKPGDLVPSGVIFDESSLLKNASSGRSKSAQFVADLIRGLDGYVLLLSGTPASKKPVNWWSQCEIACPGFLKEGSPKEMEKRLGFAKPQETPQGIVMVTKSWRDNENKCAKCGEFQDHQCHDLDHCMLMGLDHHKFEKSKNEVAYLYDRLKGLATVIFKKDCMDLPDKRYRIVNLEPSSSLKRAAQVIFDTAPTAVQAMTLLRCLSDGFQYRDVKNGQKECNICEGTKVAEEWRHKTDPDYDFSPGDLRDPELAAQLEKYELPCPNCNGTGEMDRYIRESRDVKCPKEDALVDLLAECEESERIVVFAGFQASVDRCVAICQRENWHVIKCDGRGFSVHQPDGTEVDVANPLQFWKDHDGLVAFVGNPESAGYGLTLTESHMIVFWSNSFKTEVRTQAEDRIHRPGIDLNKGATIVDLVHLASDQKVIDLLKDNRRIELMTMGEFRETFAECLAA